MGEPYREVIEDRVFKPAGMTGSGTTAAISPGVRKIPRPMVPPTMTANVKPLLSTRLGRC